ncbi:MAG: hypothetical protein CL521_02405, partial [Actinobacteria bacterium]|nr:hypothetical protein [Actinomycetota bacterium]
FFISIGSKVLTETDHRQHDFRVYYYSADAYFNHQLNPYNVADLNQVSPFHLEWRFAYPPLCLSIFNAYTALDYLTAYHLHFLLKCLAFIFLLYIWVRFFLHGHQAVALAFILSCFAFHQSVSIDMLTGNISIFEQALLFWGLSCLLQKKYTPYCIAIICLSCFKVLPLAFLILPFLITPSLHSFLILPIGLLSFLGIQYVSFTLDPHLYHYFLTHMAPMDSTGFVNPSSLAFFKETIEPWLPNTIFLALYSLFIVSICILTLRAYLRHRTKAPAWMIIDGFILTFCLLAPRLKDYSFIILIIPAVHVCLHAVSKRSFRILLILLLCVSLWPYHHFFALLLLWVLLLRHLSTLTKEH